MIDLRDYQREGIANLRDALRVCQAAVFVMATGSGKTLTIAELLRLASLRKKRSIFTIHRQELLHQTMEAFTELGIDYGVIASGHKEDTRKIVQIAMIDTLRRRLHRIEPPDLFAADEVHHAVSKTWSSVFDAFKQSKTVGLTATAMRLDGKGLGKHFQKLVLGPSPAEFIEQGYLSPYKVYGVDIGDTNDTTPAIVGNIVETYQKLIPEKRAIGFAVSIEASKAIVAAFNAVGIHAAHIDSDTDEKIRIKAVEDFRLNRLKILFNVGILGEGVHVKGVDAVIDANPTQSLASYLQRFGRCLAPFYAEGMPLETAEQRRSAIAAGPKPFAIYIDHAGNVNKSSGRGHGFPDDEREWSLDDRQSKRMNEATTPVRQCQNCFFVHRPAPSCPNCGHIYPPSPREVEIRDGELVELERRQMMARHREEEWQATTLEELTRLGESRGYKNARGWAWYRLQARENKRNRRLF
jgi:superfamily II DNA or RNA helicase